MKERLIKLNNTIFNGERSANVIQINLVRDKNSIHDPYSRFEIDLDFDKVEISRGMIFYDDPSTAGIGIFKADGDESKLADASNMYLVNKLNYIFSGLSSSIIGNADARRANFHVAWNDEFEIYEVSNNLLNNSPLDEKMVKQLAASSGSLKRHFEQKLVIPKEVITLLVVYPNTATIPLVFGYNVSCPDVNLILADDPTCIYSSFKEQFEFYDEVVTISNPMTIGLDSNYCKVKNAIHVLENEKIEREVDPETDQVRYIYSTDNITGMFYEDGTDAVFYLRNELNEYLLYDYSKNYNANQYKFFESLYKSEELHDKDSLDDFRLLLMDLFRDNFLCSYLQIMPMGEYKVYFDNKNIRTYHVWVKDEMHGCNKVITLYGGDFVMIREFYNLHPLHKGDFSLAIFKINKAPESATTVLNSKVKFDYDYDGFVDMYYSGNIGTKFAFEGNISESAKEESQFNHNEVVQKFGYHCIDVENLMMDKLYNHVVGSTVPLIKKYDSMFYPVDKIDQIIIRNYFGLPVNHRYINIRV